MAPGGGWLQTKIGKFLGGGGWLQTQIGKFQTHFNDK